MKYVLVVVMAACCLQTLAETKPAAKPPTAKPEVKPAVGWTVPKTYSDASGKTFRYRWAEPDAVEPGKKYPLVVLFHGAGERGTNNVSQLFWGASEILAHMRVRGIKGYFVAGQVPSGKLWVDTPWELAAHRMPAAPSETMALCFALLDKLVAELPVDPKRVYATGLSMGGYATWDAIQRRPGFFAAAMPVCGGGDSRLAWKIREVPVWAWHGDRDGVVTTSRSRDMVSALWAVDGKVRYTEVPNCGHDVWRRAYGSAEALDWLFGQRRP